MYLILCKTIDYIVNAIFFIDLNGHKNFKKKLQVK